MTWADTSLTTGASVTSEVNIDFPGQTSDRTFCTVCIAETTTAKHATSTFRNTEWSVHTTSNSQNTLPRLRSVFEHPPSPQGHWRVYYEQVLTETRWWLHKPCLLYGWPCQAGAPIWRVYYTYIHTSLMWLRSTDSVRADRQLLTRQRKQTKAITQTQCGQGKIRSMEEFTSLNRESKISDWVTTQTTITFHQCIFAFKHASLNWERD
jgi:hypothetical protein